MTGPENGKNDPGKRVKMTRFMYRKDKFAVYFGGEMSDGLFSFYFG